MSVDVKFPDNLPMAYHKSPSSHLLVSKKYGLWIPDIHQHTDEEVRLKRRRHKLIELYLDGHPQKAEKYLSGELHPYEVINQLQVLDLWPK